MSLEAYIAVEGKRNGKYPTETQRDPHAGKGRAPVLRVDYRVIAPTDLQKTNAANERRHDPITILKEVGAMTPLFALAANKGEILSKVELVFYRPILDTEGDSGIEQYFTIELENAKVAGHRIFSGMRPHGMTMAAMASAATSKSRTLHDTLELEEVVLWFSKIKVTANVDQRENIDDWNAPALLST